MFSFQDSRHDAQDIEARIFAQYSLTNLDAVLASGDGDCLPACTKWSYRSRKSPYSLTALKALYGDDTISSWGSLLYFVPFSGASVEVEEEFVVLGASGLLASLGGSVGLFLGFSAFDVGAAAARAAAGAWGRARVGPESSEKEEDVK